jgi:uncharacterized membrane protein YagU involved in acid resistance
VVKLMFERQMSEILCRASWNAGIEIFHKFIVQVTKRSPYLGAEAS